MKRVCASCRAGEVQQEADYLVIGRTYRYKDTGTPYRAYLCKEHYEMMLDDGDELRIVERVRRAETVPATAP